MAGQVSLARHSLLVLGIVGHNVMIEHHQHEESHPEDVGEYRQLYVGYHPRRPWD